MRTTITIDEQKFEELLQLAGTSNRTEAVNLAVNEFIRAERVRRFKRLRGSLTEIPDNDELERLDAERMERLGEGSA